MKKPIILVFSILTVLLVYRTHQSSLPEGNEPRSIPSRPTAPDNPITLPVTQHTTNLPRVTPNNTIASSKHLTPWTADLSFSQGLSAWHGDGLWQAGSPTYGPTDLCGTSSFCLATELDGAYKDYHNYSLTSPTIRLPLVSATEKIFFTFSEWLETHSRDRVQISISSQIKERTWGDKRLLMAQSDQTRTWRERSLDLTDYAGETIRLHLELIQDEDVPGTGAGWLLNDLRLFVRQED